MSYVVQDIISKEVTTKFGPKPAYSIMANGERFQYGFKKPMFAIGDEIDFEYTDGSYGKSVDLTSVKMLKKGSGVPPPTGNPSGGVVPPARGGYSPPAKVFPVPPTHGDRSIIRQNSVSNAAKTIIDGGFAKGKSADEVAAQIIAVAQLFEAYSSGDLDASFKEVEREA